MKKVTACLTAVALAGTVAATAATMAGCGSSDLRILLLANNAEDAFYKQYFAELEEEYGISIKYNGYEESSYYDKLSVEMTQGKTPDIFYLRPNEILQFRDDLQSVEDYMTAQKALETPAVNFDDISELALDMYRYNETTKKMDSENGSLYAFPKDLSTQQFGYNKTIVAKYTPYFTDNDLPLPWELGKGNFANKKSYTWTEYKAICEHISTESQGEEFGCDVPDIEIIAKSMGGELLNLETGKVTITSAEMKKAVKYQAELCTAASGKKPAADRVEASYANFTIGKVAFYSQCGTWEVGDYNKAFNKNEGDDNWGLMPTPTENGDDSWQGMITSAGYVVSKYSKQADLAKEIAASFMTRKMQTRMMTQGLSLPLLKSLSDAYVNPENDDQYSPSTRSVFIDVISGEHGFIPVKYSTYDSNWMSAFTNKLDAMYKVLVTSNGSKTPLQFFNSDEDMGWETMQNSMQTEYDSTKNK